MRVLLRTDAGVTQGTGHFMRCLTLAEGLRARGHHVEIMTGPLSIGWLRDLVFRTGLIVHECQSGHVSATEIMRLDPDWVVVDSYQFRAAEVSSLNHTVPVLAIVDGDTRSIEASLYLDHNLGAEDREWPGIAADRMMVGSEYALVRDGVLAERREEPWRFRGTVPSVLCFMGGTDPTEASVWVAQSLGTSTFDFEFTIVAPLDQHEGLSRVLGARKKVQLIAPTLRLPELLGRADVILSAAGTSAWDTCTLGVPAVLVAVVENQRASLREAQDRGLVLGIDAVVTDGHVGENPRSLVERLINDAGLRRQLSNRCLSSFDGNGKERVVQRMEAYSGSSISVRPGFDL